MVYNSEIIIFNECTNGGDKVYTYSDDLVGAMDAFGYSAFLASKLVGDVLCMWDEKMNLPCAILRKEQMDKLLKKGVVDDQESTSEMVLVNLAQAVPFDKVSYDRWLDVLKARKLKVAAPLPVEDTEAPDDSSKKVSVVIGIALVIILLLVFALAFWGVIYND